MIGMNGADGLLHYLWHDRLSLVFGRWHFGFQYGPDLSGSAVNRAMPVATHLIVWG